MKVGDKTVYRVSAQSWAGICPGATHFYGVVENTETKWSKTLEGVDTPAEAMQMAIAEYFRMFDPQENILVVGVSQSEMCMEWE